MNQKFFLLLVATILIVGFIIRIVPSRNDNIYFTMDQGEDAVYAREIIYRHQLLLQGPATGIEGLYAEPLWHYVLGIGYLLFNGHPFGGVFILILLNLATTAFIMFIIAKHVGKITAVVLGISLQFLWAYFDASRYAFNPFPLVALSLILVTLITLSIVEKKKNYYLYALIPVGLAFHFEVAGATALALFYFLIGGWLSIKKFTHFNKFLLSLALFPIFFVGKILSEIQTDFPQTETLLRQFSERRGTFSGTNFRLMSEKFPELISNATVPQNKLISVILLIGVFMLLFLQRRKFFSYFKKRYENPFVISFFNLTLILVAISYFWFSISKGWQVWHTVYIAPLLFVSIVLAVLSLPKRLGIPVLLVIFSTQLLFFKQEYFTFIKPLADPSILTNELNAVDWAYQEANGKGFSIYSYLPSVYDYPYQYLIWWRGVKRYAYLPCEYATVPGTESDFVPGLKFYQEPKKTCEGIRFLIVEPDKNTVLQEKWLSQVTKNSKFVSSQTFGATRVEKRLVEK